MKGVMHLTWLLILLVSFACQKDDELQHPYLYFSENEKPELLNRIENDQECSDIFRKLKAPAKMWLHMTVDKKIETR